MRAEASEGASVEAVTHECLLLHEVAALVDVEILARLVHLMSLPRRLVVVPRAARRRLQRAGGRGSNIRGCVKSDQSCDKEGGSDVAYGWW